MSTSTNEGSIHLDRTRRIALAAAGLVLALLLYAWIDGGREPIRPISETVAVPEAAQ